MPSSKSNSFHQSTTTTTSQCTSAALVYSQQVASNECEAEMARRAAKQHKKWNRRLKWFFCCLGYKRNKESIGDVAGLLAEFFADLNVPSSQLAAGFVLLSKYQEAQQKWISEHRHNGIEKFLTGVSVTSDTKYVDLTTAEDTHLMNDLIYYMNYSLAIFGWPLQAFETPCNICCICPYLKLSSCFSKRHRSADLRGKSDQANKAEKKNHQKKKKEKGAESEAKSSDLTIEKENNESWPQRNIATYEIDAESGQQSTCGNDAKLTCIPGRLNDDCDAPIILDDNCCSCNLASAEHRLASHNYEIIYINYRVDVHVVPFLVAADHSKRTVVVALRGTMGLSDMITDLNGQTDKLPLENCPDDWLCHGGMAKAANYVKNVLLNEHILDKAYNCRPDLNSQNYNLILCGHSLGAGAAAILGILLRPHYPTLKAYLYAPPGGILSMPAVEYTKQFATGVILGNDTVPRLGIAQLERLRYYVLLSLKSKQTSTRSVITRTLCPTCCCGTNDVDYDPEQSLDTLYGSYSRDFEYNGMKIPFQTKPHMLFVPGRLVHIVKNYTFETRSRRFFNGPIYQAVWTDNATYDRLLISEGMFVDHLPNQLMAAMKLLFLKTLPARQESGAKHGSVIHDLSGSSSTRRPSTASDPGVDPSQIANTSQDSLKTPNGLTDGDENNNSSENTDSNDEQTTNPPNVSLDNVQKRETFRGVDAPIMYQAQSNNSLSNDPFAESEREGAARLNDNLDKVGLDENGNEKAKA